MWGCVRFFSRLYATKGEMGEGEGGRVLYKRERENFSTGLGKGGRESRGRGI